MIEAPLAQSSNHSGQKYTLTEYWQRLKQELTELFHSISPTPSEEKLFALSQELFSKESKSEILAFIKNILVLSESLDSTETSKVLCSDAYLRSHLIAMRMAVQGERLESLSLMSFSGDSQKSVGKKIEEYTGLFPEDKLPTVVDEATQKLVENYLAHATRYAGGTVYTANKAVNHFLQDYIPNAQRDVLTLKSRLEKYEASQVPIDELQQEIVAAILEEGAWLQSFEKSFCDLVESYVTPVTNIKVSKVPYYSPWNPLSWWYTDTAVGSSAEQNAVSDGKQENSDCLEEALGALKPIVEKLSHLESLLEKMTEEMVRYADFAEFEWIDSEHNGANTSEAKDNDIDSGQTPEISMVECQQLRNILTSLKWFYEQIQAKIEAKSNFDDFSLSYYCLLKSTYDELSIMFSPENSGKYNMVARALWQEVPKPKQYMQKWAVENKDSFSSERAVALLFRDHQVSAGAADGASSSSTASVKKEAPVNKLKKWFLRLKV